MEHTADTADTHGNYGTHWYIYVYELLNNYGPSCTVYGFFFKALASSRQLRAWFAWHARDFFGEFWWTDYLQVWIFEEQTP